MYNSGDAAEQIVRLSLEGVEIAAKITGAAAKNIAAMIYTILKNKDKNKIKGRQRLTSMLKSGKPLKVFTIEAKDLKAFSAEAKRYGVVYCGLREKADDGMVDLMVRIEDAAKIDRIVDRFKISTVDKATIKSNVEKTKSEKTENPNGTKDVPEKDTPKKDELDDLLDEMLTKPNQAEKNTLENPEVGKTDFFQKGTAKSRPSVPISKKPEKAGEGTMNNRPSVREDLKTIREEQKRAEKGMQPNQKSSEKKQVKVTEHRQPVKKKAIKPKER